MSLGAEGDVQKQAQATFAMGRHTIVGLARVFGSRPERDVPDRLSPDGFARLRDALASGEIAFDVRRVDGRELKRLRDGYEPYATVLSRHFLAALPEWVETEPTADNWRRTDWDRPTPEFAVSDPFRERDGD